MCTYPDLRDIISRTVLHEKNVMKRILKSIFRKILISKKLQELPFPNLRTQRNTCTCGILYGDVLFSNLTCIHRLDWSNTAQSYFTFDGIKWFVLGINWEIQINHVICVVDRYDFNNIIYCYKLINFLIITNNNFNRLSVDITDLWNLIAQIYNGILVKGDSR